MDVYMSRRSNPTTHAKATQFLSPIKIFYNENDTKKSKYKLHIYPVLGHEMN